VITKYIVRRIKKETKKSNKGVSMDSDRPMELRDRKPKERKQR